MTHNAQLPVSRLMLQLADYVARARTRKLPADVADRAKLHLVDTFAAMISGSRLLPGKKAIQYVKTLGGTPVAGVIGTRIVTTAQNAALANGMFGHADETDDTHPPSLTHPGTSVVPAALATFAKPSMSLTTPVLVSDWTTNVTGAPPISLSLASRSAGCGVSPQPYLIGTTSAPCCARWLISSCRCTAFPQVTGSRRAIV